MSISDRERPTDPPWAQGSAWRELLDHIPTLVYVRDPAAGTIVFVNEALVRFCGRSEGAILATGTGVFDEFVHPDDFAGLGDISTALPLSGDGNDIRARDHRGDWRVISLRERELGTDLLPRRYVLGLATDVTERRRDAEAVRASHAFTRQIADAGPTLVTVYDLERDLFTFANARWLTFHGLREEDLEEIGESFIRERLAPEDREWLSETMVGLNRMASGEIREHEFRIRDQRGEWRWLHTWNTAFGDRETLITALDVTEEREREREMAASEARLQQTQKLESLGLVAGGIAHDFNNLLTGILGYANLLVADSAPGSDPNVFANEVVRAATRAADLCSRLLTYSGRRPLTKEDTDLNGIIREAEGLLRASLPKSTQMELDLCAGVLSIEADPLEIQQVAMNLIINASEALETQPGRVRIQSGVRSFSREELRSGLGSDDPTPGRYAFFEVDDDGVGLDVETQARIFEPFFSTKLSGRGLGLSVALRIVRNHAGMLIVESRPEGGARFRVLFPHLTAPVHVRSAPIDENLPSRLGASILVVDDEESVRNVARQVLERAGSRIWDAPDGEAGIEALRHLGDEIDAVLLDLTLPGLHGTEVARAMQKLRPDLVIVLMSGFSTEPALPYHLPFLRKPFDAASLVRILRVSLSGAASGPALRRRSKLRDVAQSGRFLRNPRGD